MSKPNEKRPCTDKPSLAGETVEPRILLSATWITGTLGNDAIAGTAGADQIYGSGGNDTLWGLAGDDLLKGGWGNDTIDGGTGFDTADFSDAYGSIAVDITASGPQNTGGIGTDTLISIEGVIGGVFSDTFAFANPVDGAVYHVSGGLGSDKIDLSGFASSAVTFGDGTISVDMGGGQSFRIDHDGVESFHFGDADATVLTGNLTAGSFSGSQIYIDGDQAFRIDTRGAGTIAWQYDASNDRFELTDTRFTDPTTQVRITDLNGTDLTVGQITIDDDLGGLDSNVDIGVVEITRNDTTITSITIADGSGMLGVFRTTTGTISAPTTIHADVGQIDLANKLNGALFVDGDLGSLTMGQLDVFGSIQVSGNTGTVTMGDVLGGAHFSGDVGTMSAAYVDGDMTIDGDLDRATFVSVSSRSHITVANVVGTLDFKVGGVQHGGTFASPTKWTFDGATQTASVTDPNVAPIADAGTDQTVAEGDLVTLSGLASSDANADALTYTWVQVAGPAVTLSDATAAQPTFVAPEGLVNTDLKFTLTVRDATTVSAIATVTITVNANDDAPTADAGVDRAIDAGTLVALDAGGSSDPEGQGLTYRWLQTGGPNVTLSDPNAAQPTFTAPGVVDPTRLTFTVEVGDGTSVTSDTVQVTVNPPGLVAAWSFDGTGETVVDVTGHGNDGVLGTGAGADTRDPTRAVDAVHGNVLRFDGNDVVSGIGLGPSGDFSISGWARVDGGSNWQTIYSSGNGETWLGINASNGKVALSVGGLNDWFETVVGPITAGGWHHVAGTWDETSAHIYVDGVDLPLTVVGTPNTPIAAIGAIGALASNPAQYGFVGALDDVRVYDQAIDAGTVADIMGNDQPIAVAGIDQVVSEGDTVTLDGGASADPEGLALTYTWVQTSGPAVTLSDPTAVQPTFTAPEGVSNTDLEFQLQVSDGVRISVADTVRITVNADDDAPNADAGPDRLVEAGDVVALDGLGSIDPEGQGLTYTWVQTGGPAVTLSDPNAAQPTFTAPDVGANTTITFDLTVSDGTNVSSVDSVTVRIGTWLEGTAGDDALVGTTGDDRLRSFGGDDTLTGGAGDDVLDGGAGRDLADYSGAPAAVTVDLTLTGAQDTGGDGVDTLIGIEGAIGSAFDDVFRFSNPVAGASYTIDGGGGINTIDLSGFAASAITFGDGTLTVDMGGGQSFGIEYQNVAVIEFGDVTARTMTGSMNASNYIGASIWIDGPQAFRIDQSGTGSIDWSYDVGADTFRVTAANATDATTAVAITDLNGADLVVDQVTLDRGIGSLTSSVDVGTITITAAQQTIGTITIAGGGGTLDAFVTATGDLDDPTTIRANVGTISIGRDIAASVTVFGDVGSISARDVSSTVQVTGDVGSVTVNEIRADLTISGDLDAAAIAVVDPTATVTVQRAMGSLDFRVGGTQYGGTFAVPTEFTFVGATQSTVTNVAGNLVPVANAGADQTVTEGTVVTLDATGSSDGDGDPLTYTWVQIGGPAVTLSDPTAARPTFTAPEGLTATTVQFRVTVADGNGPVATDTVTVAIDADDDAPNADAGLDQTVGEGDVVTLSGLASSDPEGQGLTYLWTQVSGPIVALSDPTAARPTFTAPEAVSNTTVRFVLTVSDGSNTSSDAVAITINADDDAPSVDAGSDRSARSGAEVQLRANGSDPEGVGLTWQWRQVSGPAVTLRDATSREPTFTAPDAPPEGAVLVFAVGASDGQTTAWDTVRIAVAANAAPEVLLQATPASAPGDLVTLRAIARDADGDALTYRWTQISGPVVQIQADDREVLRFLAPSVATATELTFQVEVSDGRATTTRIVSTAIPPTAAPVAVAVTTATPPESTAAPDATATSADDGQSTTATVTASATAAPLPYTYLQSSASTTTQPSSGSSNGSDDPGSTKGTLAALTLANPNAATTSIGSPTSSFGGDTPRADSGSSDTPDRYLLQNLLDDDGDDANGLATRAELPDLVVADAGAEIDLAPRLSTGDTSGPIEGVRWTQTAGTRIDLDNVEGGVLRIRLPEVFVEEELVFSVELFRAGERVVQEVAVQVQPVALTSRSLSIDEPGLEQRADSAGEQQDGSGPGIGRIWGALAAFLGAQGRRRRD